MRRKLIELLSELQWGRVRMNAEMRLHVHRAGRDRMLQWGRVRMNAEI